MFERFTERARRVIFFARYESSQLGSASIELGHLLLGLVREDRSIFGRFAADVSVPDIRREIELRMPPAGSKVTLSIDLPLSGECKRALSHAAEEADRLNDRYIGTEHLLLGILREEHVASDVLREQGLAPERIREQLARSPIREESVPLAGFPTRDWVPDAGTAVRIAEAVLMPIAGEAAVKKSRPFEAELRGDQWFVTSARGGFSAVITKEGRVLGAGEKVG